MKSLYKNRLTLFLLLLLNFGQAAEHLNYIGGHSRFSSLTSINPSPLVADPQLPLSSGAFALLHIPTSSGPGKNSLDALKNDYAILQDSAIQNHHWQFVPQLGVHFPVLNGLAQIQWGSPLFHEVSYSQEGASLDESFQNNLYSYNIRQELNSTIHYTQEWNALSLWYNVKVPLQNRFPLEVALSLQWHRYHWKGAWTQNGKLSSFSSITQGEDTWNSRAEFSKERFFQQGQADLYGDAWVPGLQVRWGYVRYRGIIGRSIKLKGKTKIHSTLPAILDSSTLLVQEEILDSNGALYEANSDQVLRENQIDSAFPATFSIPQWHQLDLLFWEDRINFSYGFIHGDIGLDYKSNFALADDLINWHFNPRQWFSGRFQMPSWHITGGLGILKSTKDESFSAGLPIVRLPGNPSGYGGLFMLAGGIKLGDKVQWRLDIQLAPIPTLSGGVYYAL